MSDTIGIHLRFWAVGTFAGFLLTGCGNDVCTDARGCPMGPSVTPTQEHWRLAGDVTLTLLNHVLDERSDVPLGVGAFDLFVGGPAETCDTTTAMACAEIDVVLSMRLPTINHRDPETGELSFVTLEPRVTVFGSMSLNAVLSEENVYGAETLEARTCSMQQSSPTDGPFRDQGDLVSWASAIEFLVSREGAGATLNFTGLPLTLTSNVASCEPFTLDLSGAVALER
jgi:hypothetical protein